MSFIQSVVVNSAVPAKQGVIIGMLVGWILRVLMMNGADSVSENINFRLYDVSIEPEFHFRRFVILKYATSYTRLAITHIDNEKPRL